MPEFMPELVELEARAKRALVVDAETAIGIKIIAPYSITTKDGDLHVVEDILDDQFGRHPMTIYCRNKVGVVDFKLARVLEFLRILKQHMVLEDLADV